MKKLLFIFLFLFSSCFNQSKKEVISKHHFTEKKEENEVVETQQNAENPTKTTEDLPLGQVGTTEVPQEKIEIYDEDEDKNIIKCIPCLSKDFIEQFENHLIMFPSAILILNNYKNIGFIYEFGWKMTIDDLHFDYIKDEYGNSFIYYGELIEVYTDIYSSKGYIAPSLSKKYKPISYGIDFYIKFEDNKLYFIFEDLSLDELVNYHSDSLYMPIYKPIKK